MKQKIYMIKYLVISLIVTLVSTFLFRENVIRGTMFFCFQIVGIMLPGIAITILLQINIRTDVEQLAFSYLYGYFFSILLYFLVVPLKLQKYTGCIILFFAMISLCIIYGTWKKNKNCEYIYDVNGGMLCIIFLCLLFFVDMTAYAGWNLLPPTAEQNIIQNDLLYWVGNTIELTKEFPPKDFRCYPAPYNYHYFSSIQLALESLFTGIRPTTISIAYSYIQSVTLMVYGAYLLFKRCTDRNLHVLVGMLLLFFTTGFEKITTVYYLGQLYLAPFGFDYGMGIFLFLLYVLVCCFESTTSRVKNEVLLIVLFGFLLGIKSTFGCIALVGIGIICINWLFRGNMKDAFFLGISSLVVFGIVYYFVLNISGYGVPIESKYPPIYYLNEILHVIHEWCMRLKVKYYIPHCVCEGLFMLVFFFLCNVVIASASLLLCAVKICKRKWEVLDSTFIIMIIVGIYVTIYVGMYGSSNMYFVMAAIPVSIAFVLRNVKLVSASKPFRLLYVVIFLFGLILWFEGNGIYSIKQYIKEGIYCYINARDVNAIPSDRAYISRTQYELYEYIRINFPMDELFITNREEPFTGNMIPGVFSEHYFLNDDIRNSFFEAESMETREECIQQLYNIGVRYIVIDIESGPVCDLPMDLLEKRFRNDAGIIYQIK